MDQKQIDELNKKLSEISEDDLREKERQQIQKNEEDFEKFSLALDKGECIYCGHAISHFSTKKPCFHWLLNPKGLKKKHFPILFEKKGFRELNTYLRWVANSDKLAQNINDLVEEKSSKKFIEETIKFKNLEWSFSCADSDRKGHEKAHKGSMPHYHFQMKVDGSVTINFNAFHIPFTDFDEFSFAVEAGKLDRLKAKRTRDAGMQTVFDHLEEEAFGDALTYTTDEASEALNTEILIQANPGSTISGKDIADLLQERERTGLSMAVLAKRLSNATVQSFTSPGDGVPKMAQRSGGRGKAPV